MLYVSRMAWSDICVCILHQRLLWFLLVRFCTQHLPLRGPPTVCSACLHRPSPTVWSWWVVTRSLYPTSAARCSKKSSGWDAAAVQSSAFDSSVQRPGLNTLYLRCLYWMWRYTAPSRPSPSLWSLSWVVWQWDCPQRSWAACGWLSGAASLHSVQSEHGATDR